MLRFHKRSRPAYTRSAASRDGPAPAAPSLLTSTTFESRSRSDLKLSFTEKSIFNLERFSSTVRHVAIRTTPASSLMLDVQVYAGFTQVGKSSLKNGS